MVTVAEVIEEKIKQSPFLEEALAKGLINLSALARTLQPSIQKRLLKDIKQGAIIMALKRLSGNLKKNYSKSEVFLKSLGDITVRSNLVEFTFANSPTLIEKQSLFLKQTDQEREAFLTFTHGIFETTLIVSSTLAKKVKQIFNEQLIKSEFSNLCSITLILPEKTIQTPGVYYSILKLLAWENINIIEVISSMTELTIILENNGVDKAFSVLKNATSVPNKLNIPS